MDLRGSEFKAKTLLDIEDKKSAIDFYVKLKGNNYKIQAFLTEDTIILSKGLVNLIKDLYPIEDTFNIDELPDYLYISNDDIQNMWKYINNDNKELFADLRELRGFIFEAVPVKNLTVSGDKIILKLDQEGFEDFIFNIFQKVKSEKERFAGIITKLAMRIYSEDEFINSGELNTEIIEAIDESDFPTLEEIREIREILLVKDISYETSILSNRDSKLKICFDLCNDGVPVGNIDIFSDTKGNDNEEKNFGVNMSFVFDDMKIKLSYGGDISLKDQVKESNILLSVFAQDVTEVLLDMEVVGKSTIRPNLNEEINIPMLNDKNSINIEEIDL